MIFLDFLNFILYSKNKYVTIIQSSNTAESANFSNLNKLAAEITSIKPRSK
jgi:hypothetical protein